MSQVAPNAPLILIVDDFDDARELYEEYLTFKGYRVATANSGVRAIEIARAQRPAVILMDLRMPGINGIDAMKTLRTDPAFNHVPIVAFTAHALDGEKLIALAEGFDEVIAKPCLPDELAEAVDRLLEKWRDRERD
jgi:CheY-like chemotaxis protein